jgi:hypothetical protein
VIFPSFEFGLDFFVPFSPNFLEDSRLIRPLITAKPKIFSTQIVGGEFFGLFLFSVKIRNCGFLGLASTQCDFGVFAQGFSTAKAV